ncbi:MAG: DUF2334 domain-containing protein, partial [Calditrichaeota bacterium]
YKIIDEAHLAHGKPISLFFRDDDVAPITTNLVELIDVFIDYRVPVHLQIIPQKLTRPASQYLKDLKRSYPNVIILSQHGWSHANHNPAGRKHEFGDARPYECQLLDVIAGKALMTRIFLNDFFLAFTPPWNRYNDDLLRVLKELEFSVISADGGKIGPAGSGLVEISTAVDLHHRRPNPVMKDPSHLLFELRLSLQQNDTVGLLLHHDEMQAEDLDFLATFLATLKEHRHVEFPDFRELLNRVRNRVVTAGEEPTEGTA